MLRRNAFHSFLSIPHSFVGGVSVPGGGLPKTITMI